MPETIFQVKSINIGKVENLSYGKTVISTAIRKRSVQGRIFLTKIGLIGDEQAYKDHGGKDKALCVYSYNRYAYWNNIIHNMIDDSLFEENITVYGLTEEKVHIGISSPSEKQSYRFPSQGIHVISLLKNMTFLI